MKNKEVNIIREIDHWMEIDGVNSISIGEREGKTCILVTCTGNCEKVRQLLPEVYNGYKVYVEEGEEFTAII